MFIYCDLLGKSWFPYYKHASILETLRHLNQLNSLKDVDQQHQWKVCRCLSKTMSHIFSDSIHIFNGICLQTFLTLLWPLWDIFVGILLNMYAGCLRPKHLHFDWKVGEKVEIGIGIWSNETKAIIWHSMEKSRYLCMKIGIFLPKLFWPTVRKDCSCDRQSLWNFEAEGREFAKFLRSLEQFFRRVKGQNNFW